MGALGLLPMMAGAGHAAAHSDGGHGDGHGGHGDGHGGHGDGGQAQEGFWPFLLTALALLPIVSVMLLQGLGGPPERMLLFIVLLPGLGALINGTLGQRLPRASVNLIACAALALAFLFSAEAVWHLYKSGAASNYPAMSYVAYEWINSGGLSVPLKLVLDPLSGVMILIITGVGFLIHLYSTGYMAEDPGYARYFTYLNLFCCAMLILVLGGSIPVTFVGWEGVGMCSYLLIGFWFTDDAKAAAGKKAFIVNRVGDFGFLLGMIILYAQAGTLDYEALSLVAGAPETAAGIAAVSTAVALLFFVGCAGKSAQIPLYVWLPDAMAGPTPVSALIHAATMVTAGVYLIARVNFLFALSGTAMWVVTCVGGATALMAATIGLVQTDIKKVLAYSTVSQLGYMFMAVGSGAYVAGVFHLMTHAFFKALLFLGAGSVIHGMHHEQDIRKMGGLSSRMKITHITFLIGCIAIAGVPGLSGFFSKDEILWNVFALSRQGSELPWLHWVVWIVGVLTAGMTAFYMFRLYFLTFSGECRADEHTRANIHESPLSMTLPLVVLAVLSIVAGYIGMPHLFHALPHYLEGWLDQIFAASRPVLSVRFEKSAEVGWEIGTMAVSVVAAFGGIGLAWFMYGSGRDVASQLARQLAPVHRTLLNKYYVDEAFEVTIIKPFIYLGRLLHKVVDEFIIDLLLVNGVAWLTESLGAVIKRLQSGNVQRYAAYVLMGLAAIIYLMLFR